MEVINQEYRVLVDKYIAGTASVSEMAMLNDWLLKEQNKQLFKQYKQSAEAQLLLSNDDDWHRFVNKYNVEKKVASKKRLIITLGSIAAAISIVVGLSFQSLNYGFDEYASLQIKHPETITTTTLQLSDGQSFLLKEKHASVRTDENGIHFTQGDSCKVKDVETNTHQLELNTIQVPYGRTAQLTLADGTQVWLNAGSQLIFPIHFNGVEKREVMLIGEGYFDVTPNKKKPFRVLTDEMTYTVLGTSFNIRSYNSSKSTSAVLVEGSLQVERNSTFNKQRVILEPGQRCYCYVNDDQLKVDNVNTAIYSSWKEGYLTLDKNNILMLSRQIEQFYNCEIEICDELKSMPMQLSGKLLLDDNVEQVCQTLCDLTGVHYKVNNNHIEFFIQK